MKTTGRGEEEEGWNERKGGREREEDKEKWDTLLEAPCHEILIIYLHGYQEPSHCLYILLSHPSFLLCHYSSIFTLLTMFSSFVCASIPSTNSLFLISSFFFTVSFSVMWHFSSWWFLFSALLPFPYLSLQWILLWSKQNGIKSLQRVVMLAVYSGFVMLR